MMDGVLGQDALDRLLIGSDDGYQAETGHPVIGRICSLWSALDLSALIIAPCGLYLQQQRHDLVG
jgi:hypothetical protein